MSEYEKSPDAYFSFKSSVKKDAVTKSHPLPEINLDCKRYRTEKVKVKVVGHVSLND